MRVLILIALAAACSLLAPGAAEPPPREPVAVFADLDGTWSGVFVGHDERGRELYRIRVTQTYRTVSATTQTVEIRDEMPDGTVITGRGRNIAERGDDGTLRLRCIVEKSNGERVEHDGRVVRGADGDEQLIWHSAAAGRVEVFREVVRTESASRLYEINGMGRYGDQLILMHGRYRRQGQEKPD